jgi:hypothetical protein
MKVLDKILHRQLKNKYSENFIQCIVKMLEVDEGKRIDFLSLDAFIKENFPDEDIN